MIQAAGLTLEINGRAATAGELGALALGGYGHFTAMQLRGGRTRGLQLHLDRLDAASREMFGAALEGGQVRDLIRHALGARVRDASVRVIVQQPAEQEPPWVMVTVRQPADPLPDSSLQQVAYQRSLAHLKHTGDFGQSYYGRLAERNGFGEALLTGPDGLISEGSMTNIGFFDGTAVVWPAAAMLSGITMQLVQARLMLPQRHSSVRVADLGSFGAVFITNSHGVAAVTQVDDRRLSVDTAFISMLKDCYESVPWEEVLPRHRRQTLRACSPRARLGHPRSPTVAARQQETSGQPDLPPVLSPGTSRSRLGARGDLCASPRGRQGEPTTCRCRW